MTDKTKQNPTDTEENNDPADEYARVNADAPRDEAREEETPRRRRKKRQRSDAGARDPVIDPAPPPPEDDGMDPFDAAKEITKMTDQLFGVLAHLRGYAALQLPDGTSILEMAAPTEADKARFEKALARLMKSAGASMSPGAACVFTAFTCYGAPVVAMEIARASVKKQTAAKIA